MCDLGILIWCEKGARVVSKKWDCRFPIRSLTTAARCKLVLLIILGMTQEQECGTGNFPHQQQFSLNGFHYLAPNLTHYVGHLVIVPQLKFDCHGYITRWIARTQLDSSEIAIDVIPHDITFQLWRPSSDNNGVYEFVGSNTFEFIGRELRAGLTASEDGVQIFNLTAVPSDDDRLYFQPGDVVGWYIHTAYQVSRWPLTVVYRPATSSERGLDMYSTTIADTGFARTPPPCDLDVCGTKATLISSVIPYITVEYGESIRNPGLKNIICITCFIFLSGDTIRPTCNCRTSTSTSVSKRLLSCGRLPSKHKPSHHNTSHSLYNKSTNSRSHRQ